MYMLRWATPKLQENGGWRKVPVSLTRFPLRPLGHSVQWIYPGVAAEAPRVGRGRWEVTHQYRRNQAAGPRCRFSGYRVGVEQYSSGYRRRRSPIFIFPCLAHESHYSQGSWAGRHALAPTEVSEAPRLWRAASSSSIDPVSSSFQNQPLLFTWGKCHAARRCSRGQRLDTWDLGPVLPCLLPCFLGVPALTADS